MGIELAGMLLDGSLTLSAFAAGFDRQDARPLFAGLPEGLSIDQFREQYGSSSDTRFQQMRERIRERIAMWSQSW